MFQHFATVLFGLDTYICYILLAFNAVGADISTLQVNSKIKVKIIEKTRGTELKYNLRSTTVFSSAITAKQEREKKKIAYDCVFNIKIRSSQVSFAKTEMCCVLVFTSPWIISLFDIMSNA